MKIAYFPKQCALNSQPVMQAFLASCRRQHITTVENSMTADAAVIWSMLWNGRMANNQLVYEHYRQQGLPVLVIEIGGLVRNVTWKISVNNVTADGYYGHCENLDWDRPQRLGIQLTQTAPTNPGILIATQHRHSHAVKNIPSMEHWVTETVQQVQAVTDRPIYIRSHPRSRLNRDLLPVTAQCLIPSRLPGTYDHYDFDYGYQAVINYNSTVGIQSALHGVNTVVHPSSLAYPVSVNLHDINTPYRVDRTQWLVEISHTEYTIDEIEQGIWFSRLKNYAFN
jgi:hypothetical protein